VQPNISQSGEKAGGGPGGGPGVAGESVAGEGAVHGHGLRRVFYSAGDSQAAVRAQWMAGRAVSAAAAADTLRIPFHDLIEQAHAAVVGDVAFDPETV
jgi:hypothetical protein